MATKISRNDYKFVPVDADPDFSEERNRQVIEDVIKQSEAYARKKRRLNDEGIDVRANAVAQYLKDVDMGGKETDINKYFGDHITYLKGLEKMEQIKQILVQKGDKVYKKDA